MTQTRVEIDIEELDAMIQKTEAANGESLHSIARMMLSSFPHRETDEFKEWVDSANVEIPVPNLDVVLVRSSDLQNESCLSCVWRNQSCFMFGADGADLEMPCDDTFRDRRVFKAFKIIPIAATAKNGKKEYVPDTPASFDISGTWGSIKTMIGM